RRSLRQIFADLEVDYPHLKETMLSAMGNVDTGRLLDPRFLDKEDALPLAPQAFPIFGEA
ncbi:MAG: PP-loop domain-containing protein, partial [Acidobacteriota bacterium]|nr:PP-loop domain-containing protein [Acidobacteriota bacterium]